MFVYRLYIFFMLILSCTSLNHAQVVSDAKKIFSSYIDSWFRNNDNTEEWLLEVNNLKFPSTGMEHGLKILEDNLKKSDVSSSDKKQIRDKYIQTYIDQVTILAYSYQEFLDNPDLDLLFQDFLRQSITQDWLENRMKKNPNAADPTEQEISKYYQDNSERLMRLGLSVSQIKMYTEQELRQSKLKEWTYQQLQDFKSQTSALINPKIKKKYALK